MTLLGKRGGILKDAHNCFKISNDRILSLFSPEVCLWVDFLEYVFNFTLWPAASLIFKTRTICSTRPLVDFQPLTNGFSGRRRLPFSDLIVIAATISVSLRAEIKNAPSGLFGDKNGLPIVKPANTIDISFSLEASGELPKSAVEPGYAGNKSVWGFDMAVPIVGDHLNSPTEAAKTHGTPPMTFPLGQNYPNPLN